MGELIRPSGGEKQPSQERPPEFVRPFYRYILGRDLIESEIQPKYYLIEASMSGITEKIKRYAKDNPGSNPRTLMEAQGSRIAEDYLLGCDPNDDLFIIVPPEE